MRSLPPSIGTALVVSAILLGGCDESPSTREKSVSEGRTFDFILRGNAVRLIVDDCEVFLSGPKGERERVVTTDFYPMFSVCQREKISSDNEFIEVELGRMAFGAGGCCATSGTWRTNDGRNWERRWKGKWLPIADVEAAMEREARERNKELERDRKQETRK
jgi:hypothetical protein